MDKGGKMKEIKFRACINSNPTVIVYFTLADLVNPPATIPLAAPPFSVSGYELLRMWLRAGNIPDLYTGLKDKNGKEIYKGDILAHRFIDIHKNACENRFAVAFGYYEVNPESFEGFDGLGWYLREILFLRGNIPDVLIREVIPFLPVGQINCSLLEVIGNIYENPELLEK